MIKITEVKYISNYKLEIKFNSGEIKMVDLANDLTGEIFEPLRNIDYFKAVKVSPDIDTIYWDNGADFAPEFLYQIGILRKAA